MKNTPSESSCAISNSHKLPIVIDLCCGMGGIALAARQLEIQVAAGVDIEAAAIRTFEFNFPDAQILMGSVRSRKVRLECFEIFADAKRNKRPTIIVSGPPCQGFSVAGPRDPNDPRNQILLAVARSIATLKPTVALIENVARILAPQHKARLSRFRKLLSENGYSVSEIVMNAADFGVAQRRKRAFFFISKSQLNEQSIARELDCLKRPVVSVADALDDLPSPQRRPDRYDDEYDDSQPSNHFAMHHSEKVRRKIAAITPGSGPMSYRKLDPNKVSNTLISGHRAPPAHYSEPRSITVREAMRLQGFPDDFRVYGKFGKQMAQVTNSVPPPLAQAALFVLCKLTGIELVENVHGR